MFRRDNDRDRDRDRDSRGRRDDPKKDKGFMRKRFCRFCVNPELRIDYKDGRALSPYVSERGRIMPRRITSNCAFHQSQVTNAIKKARILALLPFTAAQVKWR